MLSLQDIAHTTGGDWHNQERSEITGFSIDSRTISPGEFFITLPGERTDGEDHLEEAYSRGASGALVNSNLGDDRFPNLIGVSDRKSGLLNMATYYRTRFSITIVGITGSWGKTTTKEVIGSILSTVGVTHKSPGNFNTEYGLPLSLLNMDEDVDFGVFELGLQYPGDIGTLSKVLKPTIGLITGIGRVHLQNFRGRKHLAREKFRLAEGMEEGSTVLINEDSDLVDVHRLSNQLSDKRIVPYSVEGAGMARYRAREIDLMGLNGLSFTLRERGGGHEPLRLKSHLLSKANVFNVLAGASVGLELGIGRRKVVAGVDIAPLPQRLQPIKFAGGTVLNDSYNANPSAIKNALHLLSTLETSGIKVVALGDMLELEPRAKQLHAGLATDVLASGADLLLGTGQNVKSLCDKLSSMNVGRKDLDSLPDTKWFRSKAKLQEHLGRSLEGDDNLVLVKGSRGMEMEKVVNYLTNSLN
ncbi:MAG: UDP-N-acetylmuramoyl-tripeptide--D-alanyl-D-alanine ligase [Candidatus Bipolaricaulota bacterium]